MVRSSDGLELAVREWGDRSTPTIVCVHGFPDNSSLWEGVAQRLQDRFHVVAYDVRGAGKSGAPDSRRGYRMDQLSDDLAAVLDEVSPGEPVHLVAHDWGAIQSWHSVTDPRFASRLASYTSISGPGVDQAGHWMRSRLRRPSPRHLRQLLRQLTRSGYIAFFQLPVLPELYWRSPLGSRLLNRLERRLERVPGAMEVRPERSRRDLTNGVNLYRANMIPRLSRPGYRTTDVPVQVLIPTRDAFIEPSLQSDVEHWTSIARVRKVNGGHWIPRYRPDVVARCVEEFIDDPGPASKATGDFAGKLVVVTGAGSGIGRATTIAFAKAGADVVACDIDADAAQHTADEAAAAGVDAAAYRLDVSDGDAFEAFAKQVRDKHGVPDIVVNNAGIGMAGPFLDTSVADWNRVIDVNLWGVIHGSRLFAAQMVERGEGGRIVNLASAAAYTPSRAYPAYATTKGAVRTLGDCLRAELADSDIGVITICPGLIHTDITRNTRFVGTTDQDEDTRRNELTQFYAKRNYTPGRVAAQIVAATRRNRAVVPVTPEARFTMALSRLSPGTLRAAARWERT